MSDDNHIQSLIHIYIYMYIHTYVYMNTCMHIYICMYSYIYDKTGRTSKDTIQNLDGSWRLIFTTGTLVWRHTCVFIDVFMHRHTCGSIQMYTMKPRFILLFRIINYFIIKAEKLFDTCTMSIHTNMYLHLYVHNIAI
jgi:hypothetical protein